jgi:dihydrofolate reductase
MAPVIFVTGGANIGRQFIRSGLVDELSIHLVPLMFGGGTRMFENLASSFESSRSSKAFQGDSDPHPLPAPMNER